MGGLFFLWKRKTLWVAVSLILTLIILGVSSNSWVALKLAQSLEWKYLPTGDLPRAEAIVVLGGGIRPKAFPRPWVEVAEAGDRILYGAQLYQAGKAPLLILSGGRIDWKEGGASEAFDMAEIARAMGVPMSAIATDPTSLNTYENAVNVRRILDERDINRVLLVTSAIHMPRSMGIFQRQNIDVIPAPTDFWVTEQAIQELNGSKQSFALNLIPDVQELWLVTKVIKEHVGWTVYRLRGWI